MFLFRSSTFSYESGNRMYSVTARRMISGLVLKNRKALFLVMHGGCETALPVSTKFILTMPSGVLVRLLLTDIHNSARGRVNREMYSGPRL